MFKVRQTYTYYSVWSGQVWPADRLNTGLPAGTVFHHTGRPSAVQYGLPLSMCLQKESHIKCTDILFIFNGIETIVQFAYLGLCYNTGRRDKTSPQGGRKECTNWLNLCPCLNRSRKPHRRILHTQPLQVPGASKERSCS